MEYRVVVGGGTGVTMAVWCTERGYLVLLSLSMGWI